MQFLRRARVLAVLLGTAAGLGLPRLAAACATCYGAADSPMVDGMNKGILTLLGFVALIYLGVGKVIWDFRQRAKRLDPPVRHLRVLHGGKQ
ncbi:MAG TPA: hypothetical protein VOA87_20320 [Thermoanaerobaculia bacterium]|nr:hypothetical protein [Thermoanaerobaculia bacterium]